MEEIVQLMLDSLGLRPAAKVINRSKVLAALMANGCTVTEIPYTHQSTVVRELGSQMKGHWGRLSTAELITIEWTIKLRPNYLQTDRITYFPVIGDLHPDACEAICLALGIAFPTVDLAMVKASLEQHQLLAAHS